MQYFSIVFNQNFYGNTITIEVINPFLLNEWISNGGNSFGDSKKDYFISINFLDELCKSDELKIFLKVHKK